MKRLTPLSWIVLVILTVGVCACLVGCGKIHLPHNPDGSLDTVTLLQWAEAGIEADCAIQGASADVCAIGLPAVKALESQAPADVRAGLVAITVQHPQTLAYLTWLISALPA